MQTSYSSSQPITLSASTESQTLFLFALAIGLTLVGVVAGISFAPVLLNSGVLFMLVILSLGIVLTSRWWVEKSPVNYLLFGVFPLIMGLTFTPYLLMILAGFVNGASILINALGATVCMSIAAAIYARTTQRNLLALQGTLIMGLIGLIVLGLFQIFIPGLRTGPAELMLSGAGTVLFAVFLAVDFQRVARLGRVGANPFLLALSLYLDVYNLFLYVLRFIVALSGNRRN